MQIESKWSANFVMGERIEDAVERASEKELKVSLFLWLLGEGARTAKMQTLLPGLCKSHWSDR